MLPGTPSSEVKRLLHAGLVFAELYQAGPLID